MVVRIRFAKGRKVSRKPNPNQHIAAAVAALLTPAAAMALVLGIWRITADLNWTSSFFIPSGPLSHWQVWLGAAAVLQLSSHFLNRYGKTKDIPADRKRSSVPMG